MKKRILALALAATTAFSMFGASLSVSAAAVEGKYESYVPAKFEVSDLNSIQSVDDLNAYANKFVTSTDATVVSGNYYLYDYALKASTKDEGKKAALTAAIDAAVGADKTDWEAAKTALSTAISDYLTKYEKATAVSYTVKDAFSDVAAAAADLDSNDFQNKAENGETEWVAYNLAALKADIATAKASLNTNAPAANSELIYLTQQYNALSDLIGLTRASTWEEKYYALLETIADMVQEDYTATSWANLEKAMAKADALASLAASKSDWEEAYTIVNTAKSNLAVKKPDVSELKAALAALFTDGKILASYPDKGATALYKKADCTTVIWGTVTVWDAFAAETYKANKYDTEETVGAYPAAYAAYKNVSFNGNSKKYTQTQVDSILENLNIAVDALSEGAAAPSWMIVRLEELVAGAEAVEPTDYNEKASVWKTFVKNLENAQEVLAASAPSEAAVTRVYNALLNYEASIKSAKKAVPASDVSALRTTLKAAQKAIKDEDYKSLAQYKALVAAVDSAEKVLGNTANVTISKVAAATKALEDAINFYEVVLGWNKLADGSYKYGTENGYVTSDWAWIGGAWYYFDANGIMATGWQQLAGAWYYFYTWGGMAKGWAQVNGTWYYLNPNGGKMLSNGWNWIDGKCYYFYSWGGMAANTTIDGYKVDASGAWVK